MTFYHKESDFDFAQNYKTTEYKDFAIYFKFDNDIKFVAYKQLKPTLIYKYYDGAESINGILQDKKDILSNIKTRKSYIEISIQSKIIENSLVEMKKTIDAYLNKKLFNKRFFNTLNKNLYYSNITFES